VEAQLDSQDCSSFLEHVHGLGLSAPVGVVVPEELTHRLESLADGAYDVLPRNDSLFRNLPGVITRAIERAKKRASEPCGQYESQPATAMSARGAAPRALAEMRAPLDCAERAKASDTSAAAKRFEQWDARLADAVRSKATLERIVDQARATSVGLEQKLARAETALQDASQRHLSALATAAGRLAKSQAQHDISMARAAATRDMVEEQLRAAAKEVERARQHQASAAADVERLTQREAELVSQVADAATTRDTLERQLADVATAMREADDRATHERSMAAVRQADVETRLAQQAQERDALERALAETRSAAADAERRFREDTAAMTARAGANAARLEKQIARERFEQEGRLAAMHERLEHLVAERDALDESLGTLQEHSQRLDTEHRAERERIERARLTAEAEVLRLGVQHAEAQNTLEETRRNFQHTLDRVSTEHADARATLVATVAERDAQLEEQVARHSASLQEAVSEHGLLQDGFQATIAARELEIEQLQNTLETTIRELDVTRSRCDVLQSEADRLPQLQEQLDVSRAELRRQFEHSPLALFRCTRSGALTEANRALAALAGYKSADAMRGADFATTVFESPDDLFWLIERCLRTNPSESVETIWRTRNGGRLAVRLSACTSAPDVIEIVVDDLTNLRAIEDRLRQAHRMEAVGRLASEVAITCGNLLRDVHQNAQQWLTTVSGNTALGRQGELLLDEVTRTAGFLRQLAAYSDGETSTIAPVDLNRVLRDLKPVLKRVAGGDVELGLSKNTARLMVDVEAERVERLLVNVASYRRERMPLGGRLRIELATVVVDRRFIDKYPNVRPGPHALITVTEVRRTMRAEGQLQLRGEPTAPSADRVRVAAGRPGVDLGALQGLIRGCGGHLWMTVEPQGDMVVKMRLPLSTSDVRAPLSTSPVRGGRGRAMARWFQH
jgi:PAS domain S-box-containing protein